MVTLPTKRISLRSVAEQAHVSRMTVSLALRDDPTISVATRRRVQRVAQDLGYRPDPDVAVLMEKIRAKRQRGRHRNALAYLTGFEDRLAWHREPTQLMYYEGARQRADECGYNLQEFWLGERGMTDRRLGEIVRSRGIEGVLVAPLPGRAQIFDEANWRDFSVLALGYSLRWPAVHRACHHHFNSMLLLMRRLQALNYGRIGLAMSLEQDERANHQWSGAYFAACQLCTGGSDVPPLLTPSWCQDDFARWLDQYSPDAVVTIGPRATEWLQQLGVRVPDELGLANVDLRPDMLGLTGVDQNSRRLGAAAMDSLIALMRHHEQNAPAVPQILTVEGTFVEGASVRNRADSCLGSSNRQRIGRSNRAGDNREGIEHVREFPDEHRLISSRAS